MCFTESNIVYIGWRILINPGKYFEKYGSYIKTSQKVV